MRTFRWPLFESIGLNVMYNGINHLRGHHTARIGFNSWGANLRHGFEWDDNPWGVNQVGHPYQGSNYFTAARAHGLSFWESSAFAAFGSSTWEYFAENNRASLNDLINTTLGGIALGEVMHRLAWLVRDPTRAEGRRRREIVAAAIDPMSGLIRGLSGEMNRVAERPVGMTPSSFGWRGAMGVLHQGASLREARSAARPYADVDLLYGTPQAGYTRVPFESFALQLSGGGGGGLVGLRARLYGQPLGRERYQINIFQIFDFTTNRAFAFGAQGVEVELAMSRRLSPRTTIWMTAVGGANILGAVDSPIDPPAGSGIVISPDLLARREYDYGPGARFGGEFQLRRDERPIAGLTYQGYQVSVVDGTRAIHILQRVRLELRLPLKSGTALGAAGELFSRKAYFWPAGSRSASSPQVRLFFAWERP